MNNKEHTLFKKREEPIVKRSSTGGDDRCRFVSRSSLFVCVQGTVTTTSPQVPNWIRQNPCPFGNYLLFKLSSLLNVEYK